MECNNDIDLSINENKEYSNSNNITKKNKEQSSKYDMKKMWCLFDKEMDNESKNLECVYISNKNNDICSSCNNVLFIGDDGFPTCSNTKCGIIYKDNLDLTAEWRFLWCR